MLGVASAAGSDRMLVVNFHALGMRKVVGQPDLDASDGTTQKHGIANVVGVCSRVAAEHTMCRHFIHTSPMPWWGSGLH